MLVHMTSRFLACTVRISCSVEAPTAVAAHACIYGDGELTPIWGMGKLNILFLYYM